MHEKPRVADVANEVLPRQAVTGDVWMGERFKTAFEAVLETEAGRRLGRLRSAPHRDERAQEWQEGLLKERTEERRRRRG
jgi:hypothetical protein